MNNITILLPTYNRPSQCLNTIDHLVQSVDIFLADYPNPSIINIICSENNSSSLECRLPSRPYLHYTSTPQLVSMSQNIANSLRHSDPGFLWIIPDDDNIDVQQFVKTLQYLSSTSSDLVNIAYSTLSNPDFQICKDPFFLTKELHNFQPPFMLLSSLAFKLSAHQISQYINHLESSDNTYAQNLLFFVLPLANHLTITSLNFVPVIYNDYARPRFSSAKAANDAVYIVTSLSRRYSININLSSRSMLRSILRNNIKNYLCYQF